MTVIVSAADANRKFSELLRGVRDGKTYTVTSHGRPVAKITPMETRGAVEDAAKRERWETYLAELRNRPPQTIGSWTREELYERDQPA